MNPATCNSMSGIASSGTTSAMESVPPPAQRHRQVSRLPWTTCACLEMEMGFMRNPDPEYPPTTLYSQTTPPTVFSRMPPGRILPQFEYGKAISQTTVRLALERVTQVTSV